MADLNRHRTLPELDGLSPGHWLLRGLKQSPWRIWRRKVLSPRVSWDFRTSAWPILTPAALKDARPRQLTQAVAAWHYEMTDFDGVTFAFRHGDDLQLWAIFEHPEDPPVTPNIQDVMVEELQHNGPDISHAFRLLGLQWENE